MLTLKRLRIYYGVDAIKVHCNVKHITSKNNFVMLEVFDKDKIKIVLIDIRKKIDKLEFFNNLGG